MTTKQFNENFSEQLNRAIADGVALHEVLLTLESAKFEIQFTLFRRSQERTMQEMSKRIVPANGKIPPMN